MGGEAPEERPDVDESVLAAREEEGVVVGEGEHGGSLVVARPRPQQRAGGHFPQEAEENEEEPKPIVHIDQHSEPDATVVELQFGDRLGALLDTMKALKDLGLTVVRGNVQTADARGMNRFVITRADNGKKVEDCDMLEAMRSTIILNLMQYHPESSVQLAMGDAFGAFPVAKKVDVDVATHISVTPITGEPRSLLRVETADRPGLIFDIVKMLGDLSINVESAEIDTEGLIAKDEFYLTYHNEALNKNITEVVQNVLQYYLTRPEVDAEESY
eukprot:SM000134S26935  [mRNA]  locus=s134:182469:187470:+ [translate_table: standard]